MIEAMQKDKEKFIPESGYNVVGVDDFDLPGEQLYLIKHFAAREEAEAFLAARKKAHPGEKAYIYGPDTK